MLRNLEWKPTYLAICICQFIRDVKAVEGHTLLKSKSICIVGYNTILDKKKLSHTILISSRMKKVNTGRKSQ